MYPYQAKHIPGEHREQDHAETPDVARRVVALPAQHFGRHKLRRVARRHQEAVVGAQLLSEPEVANL